MSDLQVETNQADAASGGSFAVTESAARQIAKILSAEPDGTMLRVSVEGGGCSGFQYEISLEEAPTGDDTVLEKDGMRVLVDPVSMQFLTGATIDFSQELIGARFVIDNPNASSSCGGRSGASTPSASSQARRRRRNAAAAS